MSQYIEFVADRLVVQLGYNKIYNTKNPFQFMDRIGMDLKANFFETRVSSYSKAELHRSDTKPLEFDMNDDDDF